jgi:hypothetical protein
MNALMGCHMSEEKPRKGNEIVSGSRDNPGLRDKPDDPDSRDDEGAHIADEPVGEVNTGEPAIRNPITDTGLPVEEQIRKEWEPNKDGGLPILQPRRR